MIQLSRVADDLLDVVVQEIEGRPELWDMYSERPSPSNPSVIPLYSNVGQQDPLEVTCLAPTLLLPSVRFLIFQLMRAEHGERIGRAAVSRLAGGGSVTKDVTSTYFNRFVFVLKADKATATSEKGTNQLLPGNLYWMDEGGVWTVANEGEKDLWLLTVEIKKPIVLDRAHKVEKLH